MADCSQHKNPLVRTGTSQQQRLLNGLKTNYINVDEKRIADWIVFAEKFAAYLKYFDKTNNSYDSWQSFFNSDISAVLGSIAVQNPEQYSLAIKDRLKDLQSADSNQNNFTEDELKTKLGDLFSVVFSLSKALDEILGKLRLFGPIGVNDNINNDIKENGLKTQIENLIDTHLKESLNRLIAYYKGAEPGTPQALIKENIQAGWIVMNKEVKDASSIITQKLNNRWVIEPDPLPPPPFNWPEYYNSITADKAIYDGVTIFSKLSAIANHNLFKEILDEYLSAYSKIVSEAEKQLLLSLEKYDNHFPHYTLFLAFLKLFRIAQNNINTLTQRHLDFYFKEVLRLSHAKPEPNHAHIILTLAKNINSYALKAGTLFKAGKDSAGSDVLYSLDKNVVFNKASVAKLMAVYFDKGADSVNNDGILYAANEINSADGKGKKLETELKEWHPFIIKDNKDQIQMPRAQIGFAVASHYLYLTEGQRAVRIKISVENSKADIVRSLKADCYYTTPKGWNKVSNVAWLAKVNDTDSELEFTLEGDQPPVVNYNASIHGGNFGVALPIVKVILINDETISSSNPYSYSDDAAGVIVDNVSVETTVGLTNDAPNDSGLRKLVVSGDIGAIDASKPFQPFGPLPMKGNSLIIGNEELFKKKNKSIAIKIAWKDLSQTPGNVDYDKKKEGKKFPTISAYYLEKGNWNKITHENSSSFPIFKESGNTMVQGITVFDYLQTLNDSFVSYSENYTDYSNASVGGFVKLVLENNFGHKKYQDAKTDYLIAKAKGGTVPPLPKEPYTPVIQSMTISYKATANSDLNEADEEKFGKRAVRFFHVSPFGEVEKHKQIDNAAEVRLVPEFSHQGEFYIGLKDIQAGESVNLLVQLLEGTTDPQVSKPKDHVSWSYLSNNNWKDFEQQDLSDNTKGLIQSGILSFIIPPTANIKNTIMTPGYLWIRGAIAEKPSAICKLLSVTAQAASTTLKLEGVANDFLDSSLPTGTISKLQEPDSAIKKIDQPYSSFGGRVKEKDQEFYIRVSERLRHKARAITIWDYERLVLHAFPQIYKVKCLNHTRIEDGLYNEVAPGYVSIITIPKLKGKNDTDSLKPFTNEDLLTEIETYLKKKTSCHVKVKAVQPQFEEVKVHFLLKLMDGYEFNYYKRDLQKKITEFLSPWAFNSSRDIEFGGVVYKSTLINFIEEQLYVDYITDVQLFHTINGVDQTGVKDVIKASTARSILVSAVPKEHKIDPILETVNNTVKEICKEC